MFFLSALLNQGVECVSRSRETCADSVMQDWGNADVARRWQTVMEKRADAVTEESLGGRWHRGQGEKTWQQSFTCSTWHLTSQLYHHLPPERPCILLMHSFLGQERSGPVSVSLRSSISAISLSSLYTHSSLLFSIFPRHYLPRTSTYYRLTASSLF